MCGLWTPSSGSTGVPFNIVITNPASDTRHLIAFASRHPGGANMSFLDGNVRFLKDTMSDLTWVDGLRGAFAARGWTVAGQGPTMNSTQVVEDYLLLTSDDATLDEATLRRLLGEFGIDGSDLDGDVDGLERNCGRSRTVEADERNRPAALAAEPELPEVVPASAHRRRTRS